MAEVSHHGFLQVYLLTPTDCATLSHAKSSIAHCTSSEITQQLALRAIFKAHCYTDHHLSVISTYIHCKAQNPPVRFVVDVLYK